jgi:hypothetical protein
MNDKLGVDPQLLASAAEGINTATDELKSLGIAESGAVGRGFSLLDLTELEAGTGELHEALSGFCDRWEWGVRSLMQDVNTIASNLGLAAGLYHDMEEYASSRFKRVVADTIGDPRQTDEQTDQQSWGEVLSSTLDTVRHPDFSTESAQKATEDLKAAGGLAVHDLEHSANPGFGIFDPTAVVGD